MIMAVEYSLISSLIDREKRLQNLRKVCDITGY